MKILLFIPLLCLHTHSIESSEERPANARLVCKNANQDAKVGFLEQLLLLKGKLGSKEFIEVERAFWKWSARLAKHASTPNAQPQAQAVKAEDVAQWQNTFVNGLDEKEIARQCFSLRGLQALIQAGYEFELPIAKLVTLITSNEPAISEQALAIALTIEPKSEKGCWQLNKMLGRLESRFRSMPMVRCRLQARRHQNLIRIKELRKTKDDDSAQARPTRAALPPNLVQAKIAANESAALATLKNLASSQAQVQASGVIDANGNGAGEYGFFQELAGARAVHGSDPKAKIWLRPPVLSGTFAKPDADGCIQRAGYYYRIFLPGTRGEPVHEGSPKAPYPDVGAQHAEVLWCAYAWPVERGKTGLRSFFINQRGDVIVSRSMLMAYSGKQRFPSPYAAFRIDYKSKSPLSTDLAHRGASFDGDRWTIVN